MFRRRLRAESEEEESFFGGPSRPGPPRAPTAPAQRPFTAPGRITAPVLAQPCAVRPIAHHTCIIVLLLLLPPPRRRRVSRARARSPRPPALGPPSSGAPRRPGAADSYSLVAYEGAMRRCAEKRGRWGGSGVPTGRVTRKRLLRRGPRPSPPNKQTSVDSCNKTPKAASHEEVSRSRAPTDDDDVKERQTSIQP